MIEACIAYQRGRVTDCPFVPITSRNYFDNSVNRYPFDRLKVPLSLKWLLFQDTKEPTWIEPKYDLTKNIPFISLQQHPLSETVKALKEQGLHIPTPRILRKMDLGAADTNGCIPVYDAIANEVIAKAIKFLLWGTIRSINDTTGKTPLPTVCFQDIDFDNHRGMVTLQPGSRRRNYVYIWGKLEDWEDPAKPILKNGVLSGGMYFARVGNGYPYHREDGNTRWLEENSNKKHVLILRTPKCTQVDQTNVWG